MKAYCRWCKYLKDWYQCKLLPSGYSSPIDFGITYGDAREKNKNNDCKDFKRISWLRHWFRE